MKFRMLLLALAGLCTSAAALAPGSSLPDLAKQYYARENCRGAYDVLVEALKSGGGVSAEEKSWAVAYEAAGKAEQPCPQPPEGLAKRASNHMVSTLEGLQALNIYRKKDPVAGMEAGIAVMNGKLPDVPPAEGVGLLKRAADQGEPYAQYLIGSLHMAGSFGKPNDYAGGLPMIEASAKSGMVDALFQAANLYKEGMGTKKDKAKAFDYYRQAAERGHTYAAIIAVDMLQSGEGTNKDFNLAYRIARNLADRGEAYGAVLAAGSLLQQKNAKEHEDEVLYWMDAAERDGDDTIKSHVRTLRPQVVAAYSRAKAPPEYRPRVRKLCPKKTVCYVNQFSGLQSCTTNIDYWNDCDGGM